MTFVINEDDYIKHYGIIRRSGRYPWGSGNNSYQRSVNFFEIVDGLKAEGMSEKDIAKSFGFIDKRTGEGNTAELRTMTSLASNERRAGKIAQAQKLKDKGYSKVEIAKRMGLPSESSVRALLKPGADDKAQRLRATMDMLRERVGEDNIIDIGTDSERLVGVSKADLQTAFKTLKAEEGYNVYYVPEDQLGTSHKTNIRVLAPPGMGFPEVLSRKGDIQLIDATSEDNGRTWENNRDKRPTSIDSKRVQVVYGDEGGADADGVIYLRPGVDDISLGNARYAQVRIAVDDTHYLKGMAVYKDDLPDGVDIAFNTNKTRADVAKKGIGDKGAMKDLDLTNPDNPFGATINHKRGVINVLTEEGDWEGWSDSIASQVLSKQSPKLAKTQLDLLRTRREAEFEEIMALTNPTVKKKLLKSFSDGVDANVTDLDAAAMPRQAWHVILPDNNLKPTEVYAPNYENGQRVALIRYPHGGTFEIPELVVNNNRPSAKKMIGDNARDAIAINAKVAQQLSGADFDGDTVLVIPNNQGKLKSRSPLKQLEGFDPQESYRGYEGMKKMSSRTKQIEMGKASNLITDMTIKNASADEIARAVRHSMVVIDAEKHGLDWRRSEAENGIPALRKKYQPEGGASTLISRAKNPVRINQIREARVGEGGPIDPKTGRKVFVETGEGYTDKKGRFVRRVSAVNQIDTVTDAFDLSSGTTIETIYANHANSLRDLANSARKAMIETPNLQMSRSAKKTYAAEVESLNEKLDVALRNRPLERRAQLLGNAVVRQKTAANPNLDADQIKRLRGQELTRARARVGAEKTRINITPREWEAIQAGAVSNSRLNDILDNTDMDVIRSYATPRKPTVMTPTAVRRAKQMSAAGYTQADIAEQLGVSTTSISETLAEA